ncbi:T9SS type A sorting domain-containing protein [Aequorivita xiaoshiensis]|uniref:T9SS type A sorting domain-containing protein n=1 Tax=Aequorivita xiaoshiensis TaxID=2874476 RepID=A0A9X1QY58_9FLAO|nr:T9SS type A sorting domain-containing protein [Aequorivita xiaoshiensis]
MLSDNKEIKVSSLRSGIYLTKITSEKEQIVVKRLIIQ